MGFTCRHARLLLTSTAASSPGITRLPPSRPPCHERGLSPTSRSSPSGSSFRFAGGRRWLITGPYIFVAFTMAKMPARTAAGNSGQASTTTHRARSPSCLSLASRPSVPDSVPPASALRSFSLEILPAFESCRGYFPQVAPKPTLTTLPASAGHLRRPGSCKRAWRFDRDDPGPVARGVSPRP